MCNWVTGRVGYPIPSATIQDHSKMCSFIILFSVYDMRKKMESYFSRP